MSRARDLSKLGNPNVIKADENSVGFGTQVAGNPANADSSLISAGIVTATAFYGDGSNLEGVASAGLGTAVDDTKDSIGQNIYFTNAELSINENTTVNAPDTSNIAYTQYQQVTVESGSELIIADGDSFIPDVLGIGTALQASTAGAGNGLFGTVFADNIENAAGRGGPNFPLGITVAGVSTLSGNVSIGGTLTYEDVTNVDSIGVVTARNGIDINAGGLDVTAGGINVTAGISTFGSNVEISASTPDSLLHIGKGTNADDGAVTFTIGGSSINTRQSTITKNNVGSNDRALEIRAATGNSHETIKLFSDNTTERIRIGQSGQIGLGGANYGTSGQVLTSQGSGASPQWADAGGGAWEVINDISMGADYGSHEMSITGFTTSYTKYVVNFNNLNIVGGANYPIYVQYYIDGSLYTTGTYAFHSERHEWGVSGSSQGGDYNQTAWRLMSGINSKSWCGEIHIPMHMNPTTNPVTPLAIIPQGSNNDYIFEDGGKSGSAAGGQITGIKFFNGTSTTNFGLSGRVTTYGLKYS